MSTPIGTHIPLNFIKLGAKKGTAPERILLLREGDIGWAGLEGFELDAEMAEKIIERFEAHGAKLPIDYHHATKQVEDGTRDKAPAVGWIGKLTYVEGEGLWAEDVEWVNAQAKAEVEAGQYPYVSPVIEHDAGNEINSIHSVALVTRPRTISAPELLAAAAQLTGDTDMPDEGKKKKGKLEAAQDAPPDGEAPALDSTTKAASDLIAALSTAGVALDPAASIPAVMIAATEFVIANSEGEPPDKEAPPEKEAENKDDDMSTEQAALKAKAAGYDVLKKRCDEQQAQLGVINKERAAQRIDTMLETAMGGDRPKVNPNDEEYVASLRKLGEHDESMLETHLATMPVYAPGVSVTRTDADTPTDTRGKLIAAAASEYDKDPSQAMGAGRDSWCNSALLKERHAALTPAERETLKGAK